MKDQRFPFKLKYEDAFKMIDAACISWKGKLGAAWGPLLAIDRYVDVDQSFYESMRVESTPEQHKLLDEIFGKECPYFKGEYIAVFTDNGVWSMRKSAGIINDEGWAVCDNLFEEATKVPFKLHMNLTDFNAKFNNVDSDDIKAGDYVEIIKGKEGKNYAFDLLSNDVKLGHWNNIYRIGRVENVGEQRSFKGRYVVNIKFPDLTISCFDLEAVTKTTKPQYLNQI